MKRSAVPLIFGLCFAVVTVLVLIFTGSLSWTLVCVLSGTIGWKIWREREFKKWSERPLQVVDSLGSAWSDVSKRLATSIQHSRARSRTLLRALQRIRSTSDYLPDAWVVLQNHQRIETFNRPAETMLGIQQSDIGTELSTLIRHPSLARLLNQRDTELIEITSPVDDNIRLEVRAVSLDEDRTLMLARDVTELNRLLSMRQDFIANVSHELRTPLTVMLGYVESMTHDDLDEEMLRELASRLVTPVDRMRFMVDDLLTLTKLESAPLPNPDELQLVNGKTQLNLVVEEVTSLLQPRHKLTLEAQEDLCVACVASEMHSVFMNLVTNAIRYSPDGGNIWIRWFARDACARFQVQDQGIGIAPESISRLTERFYRVDMKGSRARGGTGLGLAIVKHVLIRHQTDLQVHSELGSGSTFFFDLPLAPVD